MVPEPVFAVAQARHVESHQQDAAGAGEVGEVDRLRATVANRPTGAQHEVLFAQSALAVDGAELETEGAAAVVVCAEPARGFADLAVDVFDVGLPPRAVRPVEGFAAGVEAVSIVDRDGREAFEGLLAGGAGRRASSDDGGCTSFVSKFEVEPSPLTISATPCFTKKYACSRVRSDTTSPRRRAPICWLLTCLAVILIVNIHAPLGRSVKKEKGQQVSLPAPGAYDFMA